MSHNTLYVLPGNPVALARPRFSRNKVFDSQKLLKINHGLVVKNIHGDKPFFKGPLKMLILFFLRVPKSKTSKKKYANIEGTHHLTRPDIDNCIKYVLDICNNVLFRDDSIISEVHAKKFYSFNPRTEFMITELSNE